MISADIAGYNIFLGMPWLQQHDPIMRWFDFLWSLREGNEATSNQPQLGHFAFVDPDSFNSIMDCKRLMIFSIKVISLHCPDTDQCNYKILAATTVANISCAYQRYAQVFDRMAANKLPKHNPQNHAINLASTNTLPFGPLYNLSTNKLKALQDYISNNLADGFIRQSKLPARALIHFVKKKDKTLCLYVNYRGLNCIITKNQYFLPLLLKTLDRLLGAKIYITIDFWGALNLIKIKAGNKWKTAFRTFYGHFKYMVMPFGLASVLTTFQLYINYVLCDYLDVFCIAYSNDILIYFYYKADNMAHMSKIFEAILQYQLFGCLNKCEFHVKKVGFVGFIVTPEGVAIKFGKRLCIVDWFKPKRH